MKINLTKIISNIIENFPAEVKDLIYFLHQHSFQVTLVGGLVRDQFLTALTEEEVVEKVAEEKVDYDFELRKLPSDHHPDFSHLWKKDFDQLLTDLRSYHNSHSSYLIEELPYQIIRMTADRWVLEFSSPRQEIFMQENHSHRNFLAVMIPDQSYHQSFKRRDFTVNAMGVEINCQNQQLVGQFVDPFQGLEHLQKKRLYPCGEDFFKDPVRFLRMVRFLINFQWTLESQLEKNLYQFNLDELSVHYFLQEMFKCQHAINFTKTFFHLVQNHQILLNEKIACFRFLTQMDEKFNLPKELRLRNIEELTSFIFLNSDILTLNKTLADFILLGLIKKKDQNELLRVKEILEQFKSVNIDKIIINFFKQDATFDQFLKLTYLDDLKYLFKFLIKISPLKKEFYNSLFNNYAFLTALKIDHFQNKIPEEDLSSLAGIQTRNHIFSYSIFFHLKNIN